MDTIFMYSGSSKTSDSHRILRKLSDKINLKREVINMLLYQIVAFNMHGKI